METMKCIWSIPKAIYLDVDEGNVLVAIVQNDRAYLKVETFECIEWMTQPEIMTEADEAPNLESYKKHKVSE